MFGLGIRSDPAYVDRAIYLETAPRFLISNRGKMLWGCRTRGTAGEPRKLVVCAFGTMLETGPRAVGERVVECTRARRTETAWFESVAKYGATWRGVPVIDTQNIFNFHLLFFL